MNDVVVVVALVAIMYNINKCRDNREFNKSFTKQNVLHVHNKLKKKTPLSLYNTI